MYEKLFYYTDNKEDIINLMLEAKSKAFKIHTEIMPQTEWIRKPVNKTFFELLNMFKKWNGFYHFRYIYKTFPDDECIEIWLSDMQENKTNKDLYVLSLELDRKYFLYFIKKYNLKRLLK
jgi:hypothetical protein